MSARDFGTGTTRDYLACSSPGAASSLTGYSLICLFRPSSATRTGTITFRAGGANKAQMIVDSGLWFGASDFGAGYSGFTPVADHWIWAGLSHQPGSSVYRWHHKDVTAGGAFVHGSSAFAVGNPGTIDEIRLGDGDNECQGFIALGAGYATNFADNAAADSFFESVMTAAAADAYNASPLAMWLGDTTNLETDVTTGGADVTSTFGTVGTASDPPGFDYSLAPPATVDLTGSGTVGGLTGSAALTRIVNLTASGTVGGLTGAAALGRTVNLTASGTVGGLTGAAIVRNPDDAVVTGKLGTYTARSGLGVAQRRSGLAVSQRRSHLATRT